MFVAGAGNNYLDGGAGFDSVDYSGATAGLNIRLNMSIATVNGAGGTDQLFSIERVIGSTLRTTSRRPT